MIPEPPTSAAFLDEAKSTLFHGIAVVLAVTFIAAIVAFLAACIAAMPSAADQAAVADYTAQRRTCIEEAKVTDGGLGFYRECAARVDRAFGFVDGGPH